MAKTQLKNSRGTSRKPLVKTSTASGTRRPSTPRSSPLAVIFSNLPGGWRGYLNYVRSAAAEEDEDMQKILDTHRKLPLRKAAIITPEELCDLSGIRPSELLGAVCSQVWAQKSGESAITAALHHPEVIRKTAQAARSLKYGGRDRELFFRVSGSLPDRKGASVIINNNPQAIGGVDSTPLLKPGQLPSMEADVIEMDKLLEPPKNVQP